MPGRPGFLAFRGQVLLTLICAAALVPRRYSEAEVASDLPVHQQMNRKQAEAALDAHGLVSPV